MIVLVAAAVAAYFLVPESRGHARAGRINWLAALLLSGWLVALLLAVSEAPSGAGVRRRSSGCSSPPSSSPCSGWSSSPRSDNPLIDMR